MARRYICTGNKLLWRILINFSSEWLQRVLLSMSGVQSNSIASYLNVGDGSCIFFPWIPTTGLAIQSSGGWEGLTWG